MPIERVETRDGLGFIELPSYDPTPPARWRTTSMRVGDILISYVRTPVGVPPSPEPGNTLWLSNNLGGEWIWSWWYRCTVSDAQSQSTRAWQVAPLAAIGVVLLRGLSVGDPVRTAAGTGVVNSGICTAPSRNNNDETVIALSLYHCRPHVDTITYIPAQYVILPEAQIGYTEVNLSITMRIVSSPGVLAAETMQRTDPGTWSVNMGSRGLFATSARVERLFPRPRASDIERV